MLVEIMARYSRLALTLREQGYADVPRHTVVHEVMIDFAVGVGYGVR